MRFSASLGVIPTVRALLRVAEGLVLLDCLLVLARADLLEG
jgi:hypothetical protein